MAYILSEISSSLCTSASVIRKSKSIAIQSVKAIPKYVIYKAVRSEISASALLSSDYMSLYLLCYFRILQDTSEYFKILQDTSGYFRIPGLESKEITGIFQL